MIFAQVIAAPLWQQVPRALGQLLSMPVRVTNLAAVAVLLALMEQMRQVGRYTDARTHQRQTYATHTEGGLRSWVLL